MYVCAFKQKPCNPYLFHRKELDCLCFNGIRWYRKDMDKDLSSKHC